jgi:hypothetical protein
MYFNIKLKNKFSLKVFSSISFFSGIFVSAKIGVIKAREIIAQLPYKSSLYVQFKSNNVKVAQIPIAQSKKSNPQTMKLIKNTRLIL